MGTDIHLFVEKKINNTWVSCDQWGYIKDYEEERFTSLKPFYKGRNYNLFNLLTDMYRWSRDGYKYIAKTRGFPNDASPEVKDYYDKYPDKHNGSFILLEELIKFDWLAPFKVSGITSLMGYMYAIQDDGNLKGYLLKHYHLHGGEEARYVDLDYTITQFKDYWKAVETKQLEDIQKELLIRTPEEDINKNPYSDLFIDKLLKIEYEINYIDLISLEAYNGDTNFYTNTLPRLKCLANGKLEDVRIVFWFDN